jgi:hypothetical protein
MHRLSCPAPKYRGYTHQTANANDLVCATVSFMQLVYRGLLYKSCTVFMQGHDSVCSKYRLVMSHVDLPDSKNCIHV